MSSYLCAVSCHLPEHIESGDKLVNLGAKWPVERIVQKTGIRTRCVADEAETALDLACSAALKLFQRSPFDPDEVDHVLLVSQTTDYILPSSACLLQDRLGLRVNIGATDINQGCSGYIYGLTYAKALVESGLSKTVLVLTADTYTKLIDPNDFSVRSIFGDGASATIVSDQPIGWRIGRPILGTDGSGADAIIVRHGAARSGYKTDEKPRLEMNGAAVTQFGLERVPDAIDRCLFENRIDRTDIDYFVFHQASGFMLDVLQRKMELNPATLPRFLDTCGNTTSTSIPLLLARSPQKDILTQSNLLLCGFGVGLSWGAVTLNSVRN